MDMDARRSERELAAGDLSGAADALAARLRSGELDPARLELAADLGSEAAAEVLGREPSPGGVSLEALLSRLQAEGPGAGALPFALAEVTLANLRAVGLPLAQRGALEAVCRALRAYARGEPGGREALQATRRAAWPRLEAIESADGNLGLPWLWEGESESRPGRIPLDLAVAFVTFIGVELEGEMGRSLLNTLRWAGEGLGVPILVQDLRAAALEWALAA